MFFYKAGIGWNWKPIYDFPFKRTIFERFLNDSKRFLNDFYRSAAAPLIHK